MQKKESSEYKDFFIRYSKFWNGEPTQEQIDKIYKRKPRAPYIEAEFESKPFTIPATGKVITIGPKCAPRTSPLAQLCAAWEAVNNIELTNQEMEKYPITVAERQAMVEHLCTHDKLSIKDVLKILGLPAKSGWKGTKQLDKGIKGNSTLLQLRKALEGLEKGKIEDLLAQDLPIKSVDMVDEVTGEVITRR